MTVVTNDLVQLAGRLAVTKEKIAELEYEAEGLREAIRERTAAPGQYQAGSLLIVRSPVQRLVQARALENMPAAVRDRCVVVTTIEKVDGEKFKVLAPEAYWASVATYPDAIAVR